MATPFFEAFDTLHLQDKLHSVMEQTVIERVTSPKNKNILHIYLFSKRLITKEDI